MKRKAIIISIVVTIIVLAASSITYAFYTIAQDDFSIIQTAASTASIELSISDKNSASLYPSIAKADNSNEPINSGAGNVLFYELTYTALADVDSKILVKNMVVYNSKLTTSSSKDYIKDQLQFYFIKSKTKIGSPLNSVTNVTWLDYSASSNSSSVKDLGQFVNEETGYIYVYVRFDPTVTNEHFTENMLNSKISFDVSIEPKSV